MEPVEGSEMSVFRTQTPTPGNYPKENILHKNKLLVDCTEWQQLYAACKMTATQKSSVFLNLIVICVCFETCVTYSLGKNYSDGVHVFVRKINTF